MDVLRWLRSRRVVRRAPDQLLERSTGDAHRGLADLLAAAAAPARPEELAGERAAVAAFRREYRRAEPPTPAAGPERGAAARRPVPRRPRRGVVVAVLTVTVGLVGVTAYAAGAGRLPDPVQRQLHEALADMGVPPPGPRVTSSSRTGPSTKASPGSVGASPGQSRLLELCRAWQATRATPGAPQLRPDERHALADAAGGQNRVDGFCAALTGGPAPGSSAPDIPGVASPGKPGNPHPGVPPATPPGKDNKGGNGNGKGNGPPG